METGTVRWFNHAEGFGFISDAAGKELFAHFSEIKADCFKSIVKGQKVSYVSGMCQDGRQATDIQPI